VPLSSVTTTSAAALFRTLLLPFRFSATGAFPYACVLSHSPLVGGRAMASMWGARRSACGGSGGGDDVGVEAGQQAGRGAHPLYSLSAGDGFMASGRGATSGGSWGGGDGIGVEGG
jgi:hypothetical protein